MALAQEFVSINHPFRIQRDPVEVDAYLRLLRKAALKAFHYGRDARIRLCCTFSRVDGYSSGGGAWPDGRKYRNPNAVKVSDICDARDAYPGEELCGSGK